MSDKKDGKGVLQTVYEERGHDEIYLKLGSFRDRPSAKTAAQSLLKFKCKNPYPKDNCVDWTKPAVDHLHAQGPIEEEDHNHFTDLYNAHKEAVRKKTNITANGINAGHPK